MLGARDLPLAAQGTGLSGSDTTIEQISFPPATGAAKMIEGNPEDVALNILNILKDKGGLA